MGHAAARNGESIRELRLREIFRLQKLQKSPIHIPEFYCYKYTHYM